MRPVEPPSIDGRAEVRNFPIGCLVGILLGLAMWGTFSYVAAKAGIGLLSR